MTENATGPEQHQPDGPDHGYTSGYGVPPFGSGPFPQMPFGMPPYPHMGMPFGMPPPNPFGMPFPGLPQYLDPFMHFLMSRADLWYHGLAAMAQLAATARHTMATMNQRTYATPPGGYGPHGSGRAGQIDYDKLQQALSTLDRATAERVMFAAQAMEFMETLLHAPHTHPGAPSGHDW